MKETNLQAKNDVGENGALEIVYGGILWLPRFKEDIIDKMCNIYLPTDQQKLPANCIPLEHTCQKNSISLPF